jgi:hypothetical protein
MAMALIGAVFGILFTAAFFFVYWIVTQGKRKRGNA